MRRLIAALVVLAATLSFAGGTKAQQPLSAGASQGSGRPGDTVTVFGAGWPAEERVLAGFCGNQALNGSADCNLPGSRSVITNPDGGFQMDMEVALPPEACPCVLFFVSRATEETVRFPFEVIGAPLAPSAHSAPVSEPTIEVVDADVEGIGPWTSWFGGAPHRDLVLVLRNTGVEAVTPELDVAWGKSADPKRILDLADLDEIPAGEQRTFRLPFELDHLTVGGYTVRGEVTGPGGPVSFSVPVHTYPWGWIILIAIALQVWIVRRWRRARADARPDDEIDLRDGGGDDEPVVLELPPGSIAELPPVSAPSGAGALATIDLDTNVDAEGPVTVGAATATAGVLTAPVGLLTATLVASEPISEPDALTPPTADLVLKHAQLILDEAETERMHARRAARVATQLAEAVIARAGAQSDSLIAAAEGDRAEASELRADADGHLDRSRAKAEQLLADAEHHAALERARAAQIVASAEERAGQLEAEAQRRVAALERDPLGGAIRRAVSAAFDA